jgi:hypothetical protein
VKMFEYAVDAFVIAHFLEDSYPSPTVLPRWEACMWRAGDQSRLRRFVLWRNCSTVAVTAIPTAALIIVACVAIGEVTKAANEVTKPVGEVTKAANEVTKSVGEVTKPVATVDEPDRKDTKFPWALFVIGALLASAYLSAAALIFYWFSTFRDLVTRVPQPPASH